MSPRYTNSPQNVRIGLPNWLMHLVLRLPQEAKSMLKVGGSGVIGATDVRSTLRPNQDRIAVVYSANESHSTNWMLAIVCDGVGGSNNGENAAAAAISSMSMEGARLAAKGSAKSVLARLLASAHAQALELFDGRSSTTVVALLVTDTEAAIGWVGDSRVYEVTGEGARALTKDDTLASAVAQVSSELAFELNDEYGDRLSQAIGGDNSVKGNVIEWNPNSQDAFCVLCTDGIWKPLDKCIDLICRVCKDGPELLKRLIHTSDWLGGTDNASLIVMPPLHSIRRFLRDSAERVPLGDAMLCLPGPTQALIRASEVARFVGAKPPTSPASPSANKDVAPVVAKRIMRTRRPVKVDRPQEDNDAPQKRLVIEEEPLDDDAAASPKTLQVYRRTR